MDADNPIMRQIYILMAAVAGAITALSMLRWKEMSWSEIMLTVFVGTSFAIFLVPWAASAVLKVSYDGLQTICGLTYLGGTCANALLPRVIRRVAKTAGLDEETSS